MEDGKLMFVDLNVTLKALVLKSNPYRINYMDRE